MSGSGWTCSLTECTRGDALNPGSSYPVITVKVNVSPTATSPQYNQVTVSGGGSPTLVFADTTTIRLSLSLSRSILNFAFNNAAISSSQPVGITFSNGASLNWTASSNMGNITVSPTSGTGNGVFQVSVVKGSSSGVITVTATGASNSPQTIQVNVTDAAAAPPFGSFYT